jgi:hypothetical protein
MTRRLKTIGAVLVAAAALGAVAAQGALAQQLHSGSSSGSTFFALETHFTNELGTEAGPIKCSNITGVGSYFGTTATEYTFVNLAYDTCLAFGMTADIDPMNCFDTVTNETATKGTMHIFCPTTAGGVTDEITITPTSGGAAVCHIDIPEQKVPVGISNVAATAGGIPDDIDITPEIKTLTYRVTYLGGQKGKCGVAGLHHDGEYKGATTVTGFENGTHTIRTALTYT